jgi:hypothetical protein
MSLLCIWAVHVSFVDPDAGVRKYWHVLSLSYRLYFLRSFVNRSVSVVVSMQVFMLNFILWASPATTYRAMERPRHN